MKKKTVFAIAFVLALSMLSVFALAEDKVLGYADGCLTKGDSLRTATGQTTYSCGSTHCYVCVLMAQSGNYTTISDHCSGLPRCGFESSGTGADILTLSATFPFADGGVSKKNSFFMNITTSYISRIEMIDNGNNILLCPNCAEYQKSTTFSEGYHEVAINAYYQNQVKATKISFTVDSMKPSITKTVPNSGGFVGNNNNFTVFYNEINLQKVMLTYGNDSVVLNGCAGGKKMNCSINVDLNKYNDQQIKYWFTVWDAVGNTVNSSKNSIRIDTSYPVINSFNYSIGKSGYNNYTAIQINITEKNLDKVFYTDINGDGKEKVLCYSLSRGVCLGKVNFKGVIPDLLLRIGDKAGNSVFRSIP